MGKHIKMTSGVFQHLIESQTMEQVFNTVTSYRDGIVIINDQSVIKFINPAAEKIFNHKAHQLVGGVFPFPIEVGKGLIVDVKRENMPPLKVNLFVTETEWKGQKAYLASLRDLTEKERSNTVLRRFQYALDGTLEMIFLLDPLTLKFIYVNQGVVKTLGYEQSEIIGKTPYEFIFRSKRYIQRILSSLYNDSQNTLTFQAVLTTKAGGKIDVEIVVELLKQPGENPILIAFVRDISERIKAQVELTKLYRAVEQSPSAVVVTDILGNIEYVNPKFVHITGYQPKEVFGKNPRILKSGEQQADFYKELWDTITTGHEWQGEFHNKRKNGELFWERARISPVRSKGGRITHYIAVKEDITARKQAEDELKRAYAEINQIFDATGEGMVVIDKDYHVLRINQALLDMYQLEKNAVLNRKCYDVLNDSLCATDKCPLKQILKGRKRVELDTEKDFSNDKKKYYIVTSAPFRAPDGSIIGVIKNVKDNTERRHAHEVMRREMQLAGNLQKSFLPQNAEEDTFILKTMYYPYHHVSGDCYDYFYSPARQVLFGVLFDVMGHGLGTALQTSALRVLLKQVARKKMSLRKKLSWLNQHAAPYFAEDSFAAAICFELDFKKGTLTYCSAGINYFFASLSQQKISGLIKVPGTFLGLVPDAKFDEYTLPIASGDSLYFLSDGFYDLLVRDIQDNYTFEDMYNTLSKLAKNRMYRDDATAVCILVK